MAALLASNCAVPLTSVLLLFELTRDYLIILPTLAAVGIRWAAAWAAAWGQLWGQLLRWGLLWGPPRGLRCGLQCGLLCGLLRVQCAC